jgi:hypothetical protein
VVVAGDQGRRLLALRRRLTISSSPVHAANPKEGNGSNDVKVPGRMGPSRSLCRVSARFARSSRASTKRKTGFYRGVEPAAGRAYDGWAAARVEASNVCAGLEKCAPE